MSDTTHHDAGPNGSAPQHDKISDVARNGLDPESLQNAAIDQIGAQINAVTSQLRDKPFEETVDDVANFARKNPLLFLSGAALAGFAAARFLGAGQNSEDVSNESSDPWSGHLNNSGY